jgi:cell division protein FtsZ
MVVMHEPEVQVTKIKVVGVGGGGGNAVRRMIARGIVGVEYICINTDSQALASTGADICLQIGESGLGSGFRPDLAAQSAEKEFERIKEVLAGSHMVLVTAGMGGGTGTGAAPVVARAAKDLGILTVGVVTMPFSFEGQKKQKTAQQGLELLEPEVDSLVVVLNSKLQTMSGSKFLVKEAFQRADEVLVSAVKGISDIIHGEGLVNVDFEDVRTVIGERGRALMGVGSASGPGRAQKAALEAISSPLLGDLKLSEARGVLLNISGSEDSLQLDEMEEIHSVVANIMAENATFIWGAVFSSELNDEIKVTIVATGLQNRGVVQESLLNPQRNQLYRTGTDDYFASAFNADANYSGTSTATGNQTAARAEAEDSSDSSMSRFDTPAVLRNRPAAAPAPVRESHDIPTFLRRQND